jgi:transcriptional regulator with XRE-family HTH domain
MRIREIRLKLWGWSQTQAAAKAGVHQTTWSDWERGVGLSAPNQQRIADVLGVTVQTLWTPAAARRHESEQRCGA